MSIKISGKDLLAPKGEASAEKSAARSTAGPAPALGAEDFAAVVGPDAGYRMRLAVNTDDWEPVGGFDGPEFQYLLGLINEEADRQQVMKYKLPEDKKRALLSRLLMRAASASALKHTNFRGLTIKRTKGKKPFLASPLPPQEDAPNWNANVSHDGAWVVCASEPICIAGIDVADMRRVDRRGKPIDNFRKTFNDQLTAREWKLVESVGADLDDQYEVFSRLWSSKEAFVKARGDGLGYDSGGKGLGAAEFPSWTPLPEFPANSAYEGGIVVKGTEAPLWRFVQHKMPGDKPHWTTVARGPTADVVDANGDFMATLRDPGAESSAERWGAALAAPSPDFHVVPVAALVPKDDVEGYIKAGGARWP